MMKHAASSPFDAELEELHDSYVWQVNAAVAAGHDDVAWDVAQDFPDEALELLVRGTR